MRLGADQGDHDVGEVLADAFVGGEGDVDGGVDLGGEGDVVKVAVEAFVELAEDGEGVVAAAEVEAGGEFFKERGGLAELGGGEELVEVALGGDVVEVVPGRRGAGRRGMMDGGGDFDEGFGDDDELGVLAGDIEVVDVVGEVVSVGEDAAAGADGEMEGEAALVGVRARVHAGLHHGFGDGLGVEELGEVTDGVEDGCGSWVSSDCTIARWSALARRRREFEVAGAGVTVFCGELRHAGDERRGVLRGWGGGVGDGEANFVEEAFEAGGCEDVHDAAAGSALVQRWGISRGPKA